MESFVNIAAYKFVPLKDLPDRRKRLRSLSDELNLRGTILLSPEGINLFIAGLRDDVDLLLSQLRAEPEFSDLKTKESFSLRQPFRRMLVKIKTEIIAFGKESIDPCVETSPKLPAATLKQWLDKGQPVTLLDVRNNYEVRLGTFRGALVADIDDFRHFPESVERLPSELKEQPVVMFCTGGIRCEKAGPWMEKAGFESVYQLDGGILKYFEECGGQHYEGDCFVFDQRVALDSELKETDTSQCFACQAPLTAEDRESHKYVEEQSCPYCYQSPAVKSQQQLDLRQSQLNRLLDPLPGSVSYENRRPIHIPGRFDQWLVYDFLDQQYSFVGRDAWKQRVAQNLIVDEQGPIADDYVVTAGKSLGNIFPDTVEPAVSANIKILYEDECLVVVDKPAPLPMHPCGRFNRNSLSWILDKLYAPQKIRLAHRLDSNTSGVVLFSRTKTTASKVQPQFANLEVKKTYLARVLGHPPEDNFVSDAAIDREVKKGGSKKRQPRRSAC